MDEKRVFSWCNFCGISFFITNLPKTFVHSILPYKRSSCHSAFSETPQGQNARKPCRAWWYLSIRLPTFLINSIKFKKWQFLIIDDFMYCIFILIFIAENFTIIKLWILHNFSAYFRAQNWQQSAQCKPEPPTLRAQVRGIHLCKQSVSYCSLYIYSIINSQHAIENK